MISARGDVPQWILRALRRWETILGLGEWEIEVQLARVVDGKPDNLALSECYADANEAVLTFRADILNHAEGRRTVLHELLHVAHARVDRIVEGILIHELGKEKRSMASDLYHVVVESYTAQLTRVFDRELGQVPRPPAHKQRHRDSGD